MASDSAKLDAQLHHEEPLEDRAVAVLSELARESDAKIAFQGLRRRLELHPEALSRTLRRLEAAGLVERDDSGYRLTESGSTKLTGRTVQGPQREILTLMQALLPPHADPEALAAQLGRRWFRGLRWYGQSSGPGESVLTWLAEPGNSMVRLRLTGDVVLLEVEVRPGEERRSFSAAKSVLEALAEVYGLVPDGPEDAGLAYTTSKVFAA